MPFTGNENHGITLADAAQLTANFRNMHPTAIKGIFYGYQAITGILTQEGCVGIRIYYAEDAAGTQKMVITGVDANGDDMHEGQLAEYGQPCPALCSAPNPLNC